MRENRSTENSYASTCSAMSNERVAFSFLQFFFFLLWTLAFCVNVSASIVQQTNEMRKERTKKKKKHGLHLRVFGWCLVAIMFYLCFPEYSIVNPIVFSFGFDDIAFRLSLMTEQRQLISRRERK